MSIATRERPQRLWVRMAIIILIGLAIGAATGLGIGHLLKTAEHRRLGWSDSAALLIAMIFIGVGLITAVFASSRQGLAILSDPHKLDDRRPPQPGQRVYVFLQAAVLLLAGALLVVPVFCEALNSTHPDLGLPVMSIVVLAFALQSGLNLGVWLRSDEVQRKVIAESGAACFWIFQGGFFLWAAGEKLHALPAASSWDAVTVLMGLYLITSTVVFYLRGLG